MRQGHRFIFIACQTGLVAENVELVEQVFGRVFRQYGDVLLLCFAHDVFGGFDVGSQGLAFQWLRCLPQQGLVLLKFGQTAEHFNCKLGGFEMNRPRLCQQGNAVFDFFIAHPSHHQRLAAFFLQLQHHLRRAHIVTAWLWREYDQHTVDIGIVQTQFHHRAKAQWAGIVACVYGITEVIVRR